LIAKLSPLLPDIGGIALAARDAGADAITAVNTLPGLLWHPDGGARLGQGNGGISGPALLPLGVIAVARILDRTGGMPVIGVGGVRSAEDVRQYLRAGASLVAVGTGAMADPRLPERIVRDLEMGRG
jgi:dihydroorotate dehydrogenase (NAD+) catalytic subunit